jgi:hypothetical protein
MTVASKFDGLETCIAAKVLSDTRLTTAIRPVSKRVSFETPAEGPQIKVRNVSKVGLKMLSQGMWPKRRVPIIVETALSYKWNPAGQPYRGTRPTVRPRSPLVRLADTGASNSRTRPCPRHGRLLLCLDPCVCRFIYPLSNGLASLT